MLRVCDSDPGGSASGDILRDRRLMSPQGVPSVSSSLGSPNCSAADTGLRESPPGRKEGGEHLGASWVPGGEAARVRGGGWQRPTASHGRCSTLRMEARKPSLAGCGGAGSPPICRGGPALLPHLAPERRRQAPEGQGSGGHSQPSPDQPHQQPLLQLQGKGEATADRRKVCMCVQVCVCMCLSVCTFGVGQHLYLKADITPRCQLS